MATLLDPKDALHAFSSCSLSSGWSFRGSDRTRTDDWMLVSRIPSTVHQDLIDNKKLDDPFVGFNELKAEWVATETWTYRTRFGSHKVQPNEKVDLVFDGLDTFAHVRLDGKTILRSDNMFLPHRAEVTDLIKTSTNHELEIEFEPALLKAREIKAQHPKHKFICFNGEDSRLAVRKAQYHWGWDWGPELMCAGIWKPIRLEKYSSRVADIEIRVELSDEYQTASIEVAATLEQVHEQDVNVKFSISLRGQHIQTTVVKAHEANAGRASFRLDNPELWMPSGYGQQPLYTVEVWVLDQAGSVLHSDSRTIGIRESKLIQEPDKHGKSFYFRINGVDVFCGGSCWIPTDSFLPNVTPDRYRAWMELMIRSNQKMIRIWGGGIYEDDAFYNACDELGILVWQDFMFGCGNYPAFPSILDSIKSEAIANVKRLRHHPSLVIFAGNNEDYQVQEQSGLTYDYADKNEDHWLKTDFPARYIYESLLPKVVESHAPWIPYHPGSPWGDGKVTSDPTVGDLHQWNVWHGTQEKYQIYAELGGRFNSEFGMEAFPHLATIKTFVEDEDELFPQSHTLDFHNKAAGHERRIATYLVENVRTAVKLETYIHLTQLIQSEAHTFGYRGWRKQWGDNRKCGGALVWQLNDCWPVTSWSICDYYLRCKPAYYSIARALAPIAVGVKRAHHDWSVAHARDPKTLGWEVWVASSKLETATADVEVRFVSVETGKDVKQRLYFRNVKINPNGTTNVTSGTIDNMNEEPHILAARLFVNDQVVARDTDWPQPLKYLHFPKRKAKVTFSPGQAHVTVERPIKCLVFEERQGCRLSDSAIDVVPGDDQIITIQGLGANDVPLTWTYLGENEQ